MVDRIVPATTDQYRMLVAEQRGYTDRIPVPAEPFTMWIVEDNFIAGRPAWEAGGAVFSRRCGRLRAAQGPAAERHPFPHRLPRCPVRCCHHSGVRRSNPHRTGRPVRAQKRISPQRFSAGRRGRGCLRGTAVLPLAEHGAGPPHQPGGLGRIRQAPPADPAPGTADARRRASCRNCWPSPPPPTCPASHRWTGSTPALTRKRWRTRHGHCWPDSLPGPPPAGSSPKGSSATSTSSGEELATNDDFIERTGELIDIIHPPDPLAAIADASEPSTPRSQPEHP